MKNPTPPKPPAWAGRFLEWYCAPQLLEDLQGDLHERFYENVQTKGVFRARLYFTLDVFTFLRPYVWRKRAANVQRNANLFRHYLKTAFRNVRRDKQYLAINTLGLAVGIACALLLIAYIYNELSFDRHFANADRTYRISCSTLIDNTYTEFAPIPPAIGLALKEEVPEIEAVARFQYLSGPAIIQYKDKGFYQHGVYLADSSILNVFSYPILLGDAKALQGPDMVVITHSLAENIFGADYLQQEGLLGTAILIQGHEFTVNAVIEDAPFNTHVRPMAFVGWHGYGDDNIWNDSHAYTYIRLAKGTDPQVVSQKLRRFTAENENIRQVAEDFGAKVGLFIQPLTDLHLYSNKMYEISAIGNINYLYAFAVIALFFLVSSGINYTNLAIAASSHRFKEIGVRKVMGAQRGQIRKQFMAESAIMTLFSSVIGLCVFYLLIPQFNLLMDYQLDIWQLLNAKYPLIALGVIVLLSTLSGFYPALYLSMINPVLVFKNNLNAGSDKARFRKVLLLAQFTISAVMIIAVVVVSRQMDYLRNKELGFNKDNIMVLTLHDAHMRNQAVLKDKLLQLPGVSSAAASGYLPGLSSMIDEHQVERANGEMKPSTVARIFFDKDYLDLLELPIEAGRNFDPNNGADYQHAFLVNEAAVEVYGWDKTPQGPIGREINGMNYGKKGKVIGVVKDVNLFSLRSRVEPLIMNLSRAEQFLYVKLTGPNLSGIIGDIEKTYKEVMQGPPLEFQFLDERFERMYDADKKMNAALMTGAQILIFISCLGLFGLSAFMVTQRTKEIGVRKVLGATVREIMVLLSKDYIRLIVLANAIAIPVGYFFIDQWLRGYAYRIDFSWWLLLIPLTATVTLALLSIGFQVAKASRTDPVNALKYE